MRFNMSIYKKFNEFKEEEKLDPRYYHYFDEFPGKLMGVDTNTKIVKNQKLGFLTGIIHMAPADVSGYELCTHYKQAGCKDACLVSSGRGCMGPVEMSRLRKSWFYKEYRKEFESLLRKELGLEFHRTPHSGALSYFKSDIFLPSDTAGFEWNIECKHYKEIQWNNLLTSKTTNIFGFWEQAVREAEVMKKKPLLLFRWDRSKDFAAYDDDTEVEDYVEISSFGHKFKISRLDAVSYTHLTLPTNREV